MLCLLFPAMMPLMRIRLRGFGSFLHKIYCDCRVLKSLKVHLFVLQRFLLRSNYDKLLHQRRIFIVGRKINGTPIASRQILFPSTNLQTKNGNAGCGVFTAAYYLLESLTPIPNPFINTQLYLLNLYVN